MEKEFVFTPQNVCARQMKIVYDDETLKIITFQVVGGCPGNLSGIGKLVAGMSLEEVAAKLEGTRCRGVTSCPDQLSIACKQILEKERQA